MMNPIKRKADAGQHQKGHIQNGVDSYIYKENAVIRMITPKNKRLGSPLPDISAKQFRIKLTGGR